MFGQSLPDAQLIGSFEVSFDLQTGSVMSRLVSNSNEELLFTAIGKQPRAAPMEMVDSECDCKAGSAKRRPCNDESRCVNRQAKTECPISSPDCQNQRLQRGQWARLGLLQHRVKGRGLCALDDVKAGGLICEYRGIRKRRLVRRAGDQGRYIAQVDGEFIDAAQFFEEPGRFCNHSCEPNCKLENWRVGPQSRLAIVCTTEIRKMEEITFDYQTTPVGEPQPCLCGAPRCRGVIASASWVQKNRVLTKNLTAQRVNRPILIFAVGRESLEELVLRDQLHRDLYASILTTNQPGTGLSVQPIYACSFGVYDSCRRTFQAKNQWKRHVSTIHMKLELYRCDLSGCRSTSHEFSRKDLFSTHLRQIHGETVDRHHRRCRHRRNPPSLSWCVDCKKEFHVWDDRMNHMAQHYKRQPGFRESKDPNLVSWALEEGLLYQGCPQMSSSLHEPRRAAAHLESSHQPR